MNSFIFVYRYNGALPNGDRGRRKSRFALFKRPKANGVKPSTVHVISTPQASKVGGSCWREGLRRQWRSVIPCYYLSFVLFLCKTEFLSHQRQDSSWLLRAVVCIVGYLAASLGPLDVCSISVSPYPRYNYDNQKCLHTLPDVPWSI